MPGSSATGLMQILGAIGGNCTWGQLGNCTYWAIARGQLHVLLFVSGALKSNVLEDHEGQHKVKKKEDLLRFFLFDQNFLKKILWKTEFECDGLVSWQSG